METFLYQNNKFMNDMFFEVVSIVSKSIMFPSCLSKLCFQLNHDRKPVKKQPKTKSELNKTKQAKQRMLSNIELAFLIYQDVPKVSKSCFERTFSCLICNLDSCRNFFFLFFQKLEFSRTDRKSFFEHFRRPKIWNFEKPAG